MDIHKHFFCVWDPTQCYIQVTKISTLKTCKDFQWKNLPCSTDAQICIGKAYSCELGGTNNLVMVFKEA